jgi:hypothetical protein
MRQQNWFFGIVVLAMVFLLADCANLSNDEDKTEDKNGTVDFTSHPDYSILVQNNTGERLVAFKGELLASQLIGGIPAQARNHGLPKNTTLFYMTEDFPLILLTEAQYNANKNSLQTQRNSPFTRLYVFYNNNGANNAYYEIAAGLGGNNTLTIINPTDYNVELRNGGIAGEILGYAPSGITATNFKLKNGSYNIFPVFIKYNPLLDVIERVYPKMRRVPAACLFC